MGVGSPTWCCHHHFSVCLRLWNRCKPAKLVVVGLVDVRHGGKRQIGCANRHGNQVTIECVAGGKTSVKFMFHPPAEGPEFCIEPVGCMCSEAVGISAGQWTLLVAGPFGSLVGATNGLSRHPNPFGVTIWWHICLVGILGEITWSCSSMDSRWITTARRKSFHWMSWIKSRSV